MKQFFNWFNTLSLTTKIIIVIIVILIIWYLTNKYGTQIKRLFQPKDINYVSGETGANAGYTIGSGDVEKGKLYLEDLAKKLYNDIYDTPVNGHSIFLYPIANSLSDADLEYLAKHYKKHLTQGTSLYDDLDGEWFVPSGDALQGHLSKIGQR